MRRCALALGVEILSLLLLTAWALSQSVSVSRGRDEIGYIDLQDLPLQQGQVVTQAVPLQADDLSAVAFTYKLAGSVPAQARVQIRRPSGRLLVDTTATLPPSTGLRFLTVPVSGAGSAAQVLLSIQRLGGGGAMDLQAFPPGLSAKPSIDGSPGLTLAVRTHYGALRPAALKASVYAQRVDSLAPPWLKQPVAAILALLMVALGVTMVALLIAPAGRLPSPIMAAESVHLDAPSLARDRDPRLP